METSPTHVRRTAPVAAIQWTGSNFPDVERFLIEHLGEDCGPRNEPDEDDNMVQFYAWDDDQEVDPGWWIVIHLNAGRPDGEIMHADEFAAAFRPVAAP
jgi:hypothetical protein